MTQALQVVRGDIDVASSIGPDQEDPLRRVASVVVRATPSATTFYVLMNNNPDVGGPFSTPKVQQAVRYALDYDGIMKIAGSGSARLAGVIPTLMPGSLPSSDTPRSFTTTRAPCVPRRRAIDAPIPLPAPVTTATLPSKAPMSAKVPAQGAEGSAKDCSSGTGHPSSSKSAALVRIRPVRGFGATPQSARVASAITATGSTR